ncbi:MAG TPA: acylphosphatase [Gemmatimonadaceae bacterium]|nr:acylphosphatase [Gemmatimonadaceae bacterium]
MARYRLRVTGVVQGVGFRWFTLRAARRLELAGWVRNDADGSVEVLVEGSEGAVDRFVEELRTGPEGASVSEVRRSAELPGEQLPSPFEIARRG